jgi:GNAT superfamily N-acetyltransferase
MEPSVESPNTGAVPSLRNSVVQTSHMSSVILSSDASLVTGDDLAAFFVGWPDPPTYDERLGILRAADMVVIARDASGCVVGFATAITDHRFAAYIPLVEVLPVHQGRGIGSSMVEYLLERLSSCYMIDLGCDADVVPFYQRLGGTRVDAVAWRNYDRLHADRSPGTRS